MSKHVTLEAQKRTATGTAAARRSRREGLVPGVVYGAQQDEYPLQIDARKFDEILRHSASQNFLVDLKIEGAKEASKLALVQEVQHHPLSGQILHVDFNAVREDKEIRASVPLELTGEAPGIKAGGVLEQLHHEIEVQCLPANLPDGVTADISHLELGDTLQVSEINFGEGVTPTLEPHVHAAIISIPRVSEEIEAEEAAALEAAEAAAAEAEEGAAAEGEGDTADAS